MSTLPLFDAPALLAVRPPELRKFQAETLGHLRTLVTSGKKKRVLVVGPTGCGKMVLIAAIIKSSSLPAIFVCHRLELIDQCAAQLQRFGLTNLGVIRGNDSRADLNASVQVASIQTLARRDKPFQSKPVLIIVDEAHRSAADSYLLHVFRAYPQAIILGFTATPVRLDGRPLGGELYEHLEVMTTYEEIFKRSDWLARPIVYAAPLRVDLSQVRMTGNDFDEEALAGVMRSSVLEGQIVDHWLRLAHLVHTGPGRLEPGPRRRTLVFAVNVAHSQEIAARFEKAGVRVAHLDGTTPEDTRRAIWRDLGSGALDVVTNCMVGIEGIDVPEIKCVVWGRPTHSMVVARQSAGRGMRPWGGQTPLILDHAGNFDRTGCPFEDLHWSLTHRAVRFGKKLPMRMCPKCYAYCQPGLVLCPYCGAEFPRQDPKQAPAETQAELAIRASDPEAVKLDYFNRQLTTAKAKGFKPGYASALYKERYGKWPPQDWGERARNEFACDPMWQGALARREKRRNQAQERTKLEDEKMSEKSPEEQAMEQTLSAMDEEDFAGWLGTHGIGEG
jgi:superfamily II DNA or RNA helicase